MATPPVGQRASLATGASRPLGDQNDVSSSSYSASSYTESAQSFDTLDDLLNRFTLEFKPEYTLKLRNRVGPIVVGADASHIPDLKENHGAMLVKPVDRDSWWRRLRVDSSGEVTLRSRKLSWWVFTLDLEGHVNPLRRTTDASFRLATKWDVARGEFRNKRRVGLGDATEGRVHWSVNYHLPELEGSFGASARRVSRAVHADVGYAHAEVPKVELVVWPWRNGPRQLPSPAAAAAPAAAALEGREAAAEAEPAGAAAPGSGGGGGGGDGRSSHSSGGGAVRSRDVPALSDDAVSAPAQIGGKEQRGREEGGRGNPAQQLLGALAHHIRAVQDSWRGAMPVGGGQQAPAASR